MTPAQSLLRAATGLNLSRQVVERAIKNRMEQTGARDHDAYLEQMAPDELTALMELVVVPESWFYRDPQAFRAAAEYIRERVAANAGRQVRILSIPCAGGEEPYTMAMVLSDAGLPQQSFTIDAVDISPASIARAKSGIYGRNAFRSQDLGFRERHFSCAGDGDYRINDAIRQRVRFRQGNLLTFDSSNRLGYYDVIFCRNLLIYFDKPTTGAAIARLEALLVQHGQLFVGYAEVPSFCQQGFTPLPYLQAFGLIKEVKKEVKPQAPSQSRVRATASPAGCGSAPAAPLGPTINPAVKPAVNPTVQPVVQPDDLLTQARKLADLGRYQEADDKCRAHLAQAPESAEAYFILGLLNEQAPALAEDYWRRCIYLQPDHYEALCHLALLAETNSDPVRAAALKARAARIYKRLQAS